MLVTVVTFQENNGEETVTLTYGWYLASISLAIAALATPCYAVDGCLTVKKKADISKTRNVAPRPTALTEYQRQRYINDFNYQMSKHREVLPPLLGLKQNLSRLYDGQLEDHPPPRPITPVGSDIDTMETIDMDILKTQMLVPDASNYSHNSMYDDEEFVHPAPKLVSADLSIKNIFPKNLSRGYDSDASSIRSGYSLGGGQLDDSDLEIYLVTNDIKSNNGSEDDRPRSREAFVKNAKKHKNVHKVTPKHIDGKMVTKIEHEGLPTIKVIGPDRDYKSSPSRISQRSDDQLLPSEVEIKTIDSPYLSNRSSSARSSRRDKRGHDNDGYVTSDDEIYSKQGKKTDSNTKHATIGTGDDLQDDTKQVSRKKSSKRKKHKRNKLDENNKNDELITTEKDLGQNDVQEKVLEKERDFTGNEGNPQTETVIDDKNQFNGRNSEKRSRKQKKHRRNKSEEKNDERQSDDGEIHRRHSSKRKEHKYENPIDPEVEGQVDNIDEPETLVRRRSSKKKKRSKEHDDETSAERRKHRSDKKKNKHHKTKPYIGTDLTYDHVYDGEGENEKEQINQKPDTEDDKVEAIQSVVDREKTADSIDQVVDEILQIPSYKNEETYESKF